MSTNDLYDHSQYTRIKELANSLYLSNRDYDAAWNRAVELLGLPKPPIAEPVSDLPLSDADLDVIMSALADAYQSWEKAEAEHGTKSVKTLFGDLKRHAFSLHICIGDHRRKAKFPGALTEAKPESDDRERQAIRDLARFYVAAYAERPSEEFDAIAEPVGIVLDRKREIYDIALTLDGNE